MNAIIINTQICDKIIYDLKGDIEDYKSLLLFLKLHFYLNYTDANFQKISMGGG